MPFDLLLLPLLGGFIFIRLWNVTRYYIIRADKERLIFFASIAGLACLVFAFAANKLAAYYFPCKVGSFCLTEWWQNNIPFNYSDISVTAFLIGFLGWIPLNLIWRRTRQIDRIINNDANPFELLLKRSQDKSIAVSVTLISGKVYIGLITHKFNPAIPTQNISLLPLQSGYREEETKEMVLTTNYSNTYLKLEADIESAVNNVNGLESQRAAMLQNDRSQSTTEIDTQIKLQRTGIEKLENITNSFQLVIPVSQIASINLYIAGVHETYFLPSPEESSD